MRIKALGHEDERSLTYSGGGEKYKRSTKIPTGDRILSDVTCLLNCNVSSKLEDGNKEELLYAKQLQSLSKVYSRFACMGIFASCTEDQVIDSYLAIVRYGMKYFSIESIDVLEFWSKI